MNPLLVECGGVVLALLFGIRAWRGWRAAHAARAALLTPLVDAALLEQVLAPGSGDDPNILAEVRDTLLHLNREAYATEFWGLHTQIAALFPTLNTDAQATLRRALLRLLGSGNRWLALLAARACADLHIPEAVPALRALLQAAPSPAKANRAEASYRVALEQTLHVLGQSAEAPSVPARGE